MKGKSKISVTHIVGNYLNAAIQVRGIIFQNVSNEERQMN